MSAERTTRLVVRALPTFGALVLAVPAAASFTGWMVWPAVALGLFAGARAGRALARRIAPEPPGGP